MPFLVIGSTLLYVWPGETERLFAWTIKPELTPLLMGAGYASGVVFFLFVARSKRWLEVSFGFVGITVFATLMGIATILHWEKFNHDHITFFGWTRAVRDHTVPRARTVVLQRPVATRPVTARRGGAAAGRVALGVIGSTFFVVGLVIFVKPSLAVEHWPWDVTPLTARVVGASRRSTSAGRPPPSTSAGPRCASRASASSPESRCCCSGSSVRGTTCTPTGRAREYLGAQLALFTLLASLIVTMSRRRSANGSRRVLGSRRGLVARARRADRDVHAREPSSLGS